MPVSIWEVAWPGIPTHHVTDSYASGDVRRVPRRRRIRIQNGYTDGVNLICRCKSRQALRTIKIESARFSEYVYICDGHNLTDGHEAPWALRAAAESGSDSYDKNICPTKTTHRTHTSGPRSPPKELSLSGGPLSGFVCTCYRPSKNAWNGATQLPTDGRRNQNCQPDFPQPWPYQAISWSLHAFSIAWHTLRLRGPRGYCFP